MKMDCHTHYYPPRYFETIRETPSEFSFGTDPTGRTIIRYRGARFFGVTPPMTDPDRRLEEMDRVGIDVEVLSLSTPNVFFADASGQPDVARMVNDGYAELCARHPKRFKGFASIPMDAPEAAVWGDEVLALRFWLLQYRRASLGAGAVLLPETSQSEASPRSI